jgi:tellurium resistance protein TerD
MRVTSAFVHCTFVIPRHEGGDSSIRPRFAAENFRRHRVSKSLARHRRARNNESAGGGEHVALNRQENLQAPPGADAGTDPHEIVMGLHWEPSEQGARTAPVDLDALCVLFGAHARVLEIIHPGNPRNAGGSVIHTGDSRTGASSWDDERIFVFLHALPREVTAVGFMVVSATGRPFHEVRGATCHVSDHGTEHERLRIDLTRLQGYTAWCVANVARNRSGWSLAPDGHAVPEALLGELVSLVKRGKQAKHGQRAGR